MTEKSQSVFSSVLVIIFLLGGAYLLRQPKPTAPFWPVFAAWREAVGRHDLAAMNNLSFRPEAPCPGSAELCAKQFDLLYRALSSLRESDFRNLQVDGERASLTTDPRRQDIRLPGFSSGPSLVTLYFAKDGTGAWKFLSFGNTSTSDLKSL